MYSLMLVAVVCPLSQVPEAFGPVRAVTEGKQGELLVGTTKNTVLTGSFPETLNPIVQVHHLSISTVTSYFLRFSRKYISIFTCL